MGDELIVTLEVCEGKNPGKPVGFYGSGKRSSIVFLPKHAPIGTKVRVRLEKLTNPDGSDKLDGGSKPMFEGRPAPDEVIEQWLEENGQIVKFEVTLDWQHPFDSSKAVDPTSAKDTKVLEHRPIAERRASPIQRQTPALVWGTDWASSTVEVTTTETIPIEAEAAVNGQRSWKKVREEPGTVTTTPFPLASWSVVGGTWQSNRLAPTYDPAWTLTIRAKYQPQGSSWETSHDHATTWSALPAWLQQELTAQYTLCVCGQHRIDQVQAGGYSRCEQCRTEAVCDQCGKVTGKVTLVGTRTVCDGCQPYVTAEDLLMLHLSSAHRQQLAAEASALLGGDHYDREAGEVLLRATADHLTDDWKRKSLIEKWGGYDHYYFTSEGIFGSKLDPAALAILRHLPSAAGNGLVELVAWVYTTNHKFSSASDRERDFYAQTQVNGKACSLPLSESAVKLLAENLSKSEKTLSTWLRGTEADRQTLVVGCSSLSDRFARKIDEILQADRQDYATGATVIAEAKAAQQRELAQPRYQPASKPVAKPQQHQPSAPPPRPTAAVPPPANLDGLSSEEKLKALQDKFRRG